MVRMLLMVRLGSSSASILVSSGSSVPGAVLVTSMIPPMKCELNSSFCINGVVVIHILSERHVKHGAGGDCEGEAREIGVANDSDDAVMCRHFRAGRCRSA